MKTWDADKCKFSVLTSYEREVLSENLRLRERIRWPLQCPQSRDETLINLGELVFKKWIGKLRLTWHTRRARRKKEIFKQHVLPRVLLIGIFSSNFGSPLTVHDLARGSLRKRNIVWALPFSICIIFHVLRWKQKGFKESLKEPLNNWRRSEVKTKLTRRIKTFPSKRFEKFCSCSFPSAPKQAERNPDI